MPHCLECEVPAPVIGAAEAIDRVARGEGAWRGSLEEGVAGRSAAVGDDHRDGGVLRREPCE